MLVVRSPLFEVDEIEALRKHAVHVARNGAMAFHDARRYPLGNASTLKNIIIDWPHQVPLVQGQHYRSLIRNVVYQAVIR